MFTYPKSHFSENHNLAPRGCCAPKFLHALENHQVLLAHPPPGTAAPLTTFFKWGSKIGSKCNKLALITLFVVDEISQKFFLFNAERINAV